MLFIIQGPGFLVVYRSIVCCRFTRYTIDDRSKRCSYPPRDAILRDYAFVSKHPTHVSNLSICNRFEPFRIWNKPYYYFNARPYYYYCCLPGWKLYNMDGELGLIIEFSIGLK